MVRTRIIVSSLLLTILIFALGILLNYSLDFMRIDAIADVMSQHELNTAAYLAEQEFTDSFGGNRCEAMNARIAQLKEEIKTVGADLGSYSSFSFFKKKDYDYLKRKYFLLELRFLTLIEQLNNECNRPYIPIIFFYKIDDDLSERQGFILADLSKDYEQEVVVLSIDKDYKDEPLVQLLAAKYNITTAPTIIFDSQKKEGLVYAGELNATIRNLLRRADPSGQAYGFTYVLDSAGIDADEFAKNLSEMLSGKISAYARADLMLMLGRITKNDSMICESLQYYDLAVKETKNSEKQALIYETIASIDCGRNKKAFLLEAARLWKSLNNTARAKLDESLALSKKINLKFETGSIEPELAQMQDASGIIIGETSIAIYQGGKVMTQADRVKRDWLGLQAEKDIFGSHVLTTFSERLSYNKSELREDIGWHEGGRMEELAAAGIEPVVAYGALVARLNNKWYASDENGVFRFEVPLDKLQYPTTRFLREDIAVIMDTHGINMLVEQAIRNNVSAVMGCCDHPGKIKAAAYLAKKGIPAICLTDKYLGLALGHNLSIVGSPPMKRFGDKIIIGSQPVEISAKEPVVVMNSTDLPYAVWYYQTPANYFSALQESIPLNLYYVQVNGFNQMEKVVQKAKESRAKVIAARVFNSNDYSVLKQWLQSSPGNRAILFHSASYPYGYLLLKEFPGQTSFDDPNPRYAR
ncbi:MAG: hypothetical protein QXK08_00455 [Candidatus Woesearchaeota archaeon]